MNNRKILVVVLVLFSLCFAAFAEDSLLLSDVPIVYGEEGFVQRIEAKTGGERDAVGVVLSGGSARAFAHIGVLQYLEEQGVHPDYIVSNSMGSIVALLYGAGMTPDQILELVTSADFGRLFDFSIPLNTGLLNVSKFKSFVGAYVGEGLRLEDLVIPVMVVCEDMVTKRQVLITEGDFLDVLVASFALPVYFGSVEYDGHVLIDGGIANLVPVDVAYRYSDQVLVSTTFYAGKDLNLKNPLTGLNVSIDIGKTRQGVSELKDHPDAVWVRCNVEDFSFMDFKSGALLAQHGYDSCLEMEEGIARLVAVYNGEGLEDDASNATAKATSEFDKLLTRKRVSFASRFPKLKRSYEVYDRTKTVGSSSNLGFSFESFENEVYSLRDDSVLGLDYSFSTGNFDLKASVGAAFSFRSFGYGSYESGRVSYPHVLPDVDVCLDYYLFNNIKASVRGSMNLSRHSSSKGVAFYFDVLQSIQYRSGSFSIGKVPGSFSFAAVQTFEVLFPGEGVYETFYDSSSPLLGGEARLSYSSQVFSSRLGVGVQHLGWFGKDFSRTFGTASIELGVNPSDRIGIGVDVASRFSFDGGGDVPVFSKDGFQLADPVIRSQGSPNAALGNDQQYIIAAGLSFDYMFQSGKLGIAELILLSNSSVGAFCNLLWYDGATPAVQLGAKVSCDFGFLGLKDAPLAVGVSYDFSIGKVLWSVSLRSSF